MSSFAGDIQIVCLGTLALLALYTLSLARYRGLDGHLTVRWLLTLGAAFLTIVFWRWLPFFSITSSLQERELLLMVTVLMFAFVIFLMLDLLVRSSRQSGQIKRLTQELAIQRARLDAIAPEKSYVEQPSVAIGPSQDKVGKTGKASIVASLWILLCIGFSVFENFGYNSPSYPLFLKTFLSAAYLE